MFFFLRGFGDETVECRVWVRVSSPTTINGEGREGSSDSKYVCSNPKQNIIDETKSKDGCGFNEISID